MTRTVSWYPTALAAALIATIPLSAPAKSSWLWRIGAGPYYLTPEVSGYELAGLPGSDLRASADLKPGVSIVATYRDKVSLETVLTLPFSFELAGSGTAAALGRLGSIDFLGPVLVARYTFRSSEARYRPFAGIGVMRFTFHGEESSPALDAMAGAPVALHVASAWSPVVQLGLDARISQHWIATAYTSRMGVDTMLRVTTPAGAMAAPITIDSWAFGLLLNYRFGQ